MDLESPDPTLDALSYEILTGMYEWHLQHLHKSHLKAPERVARLLIATSMAYVWVHAVAVFAHE